MSPEILKWNEKNYPAIFYEDDDIDDLNLFEEIFGDLNKPVLLFEEGDKMVQTFHNSPP